MDNQIIIRGEIPIGPKSPIRKDKPLMQKNKVEISPPKILLNPQYSPIKRSVNAFHDV